MYFCADSRHSVDEIFRPMGATITISFLRSIKQFFSFTTDDLTRYHGVYEQSEGWPNDLTHHYYFDANRKTHMMDRQR